MKSKGHQDHLRSKLLRFNDSKLLANCIRVTFKRKSSPILTQLRRLVFDFVFHWMVIKVAWVFVCVCV